MTLRFYILFITIILLIGGGQISDLSYKAGHVLLFISVLLLFVDFLMLWLIKGVDAIRRCAERFSNGDDNIVTVRVENRYRFPVRLTVIDEVPIAFQQRDINFKLSLRSGESKTVSYSLRPLSRGVYGFGHVRVFVSSPIGLVERRITCSMASDVKVYPSFLMLQRYEFMAMHNRLSDMGIKKVRHVGHNTEFEHIKEYVKGDDYRFINWKASARCHVLMSNVYQSEKSQQVFNVIDKGRVMQQAFCGMTLFDYAINASLVMSYVALRKDDKAGLITFDNRFDTFIPASRRHGQMQDMLEALYAQRATFGESDFSLLVHNINQKIARRSLIILYTNFSGKVSFMRQLPYLRQIASRHRLLVVFFEDTELCEYLSKSPSNTEDYYRHVIAGKVINEQRLVTSQLRRYGILSVLTTPNGLSVNVINKYLELKMKEMLT